MQIHTKKIGYSIIQSFFYSITTNRRLLRGVQLIAEYRVERDEKRC